MNELLLAKPVPLPTDIIFENMTWKTTAILKDAVFHHDCVTYENNIYAVGGALGSAAQKTFSKFDGAKWTDMEQMPVGRCGHVSVIVGNKLYVCAGLNATINGQVNTFTVYDFDTKVWSTLSPLPVTTSYSDGCAVGTDIYIFGGYTTRGNEVAAKFIQYKYDTLTDKWTELSTSISPRMTNGCAAIGKYIYIMGGRQNGIYKNDVYRYDTETGTVIQCANMPDLIANRRSVISMDGRLLSVWGATTGGANYNRCTYYTPEQDKWTLLKHASTTPLAWGGCSELRNRVYYFGGMRNNTPEHAAYVFS